MPYVIKAVKDLRECVQGYDPKVREQMIANLRGPSKSFNTNRINEKLADFARKKDRRKVLPALYRQDTGTDRTAVSTGKVRYVTLRKKKHERALVAELRKRGYHDVRIDDGWKPNLQKLKDDEGNDDAFDLLTSVSDF